MSLARTALRIAAVAAMNADPVIAALCPGRVYDSRIDELDAKDPVPVIVVYTEDNRGHPWSVNNGGPPFDHACDLHIEISMRVITEDLDEAGAPAVVIGMAETDTEAEVAIDLLEERAIWAVTNADTPQAALIRNAVVRRATELKSIRFASAESGSKIALRMVTLTMHLKNSQPDLGQAASGPFAALPDPLRTVAAAQPSDSSAYATCLGIAAMLAPSVAAPVPMTGIDVTIQPQHLSAAQTPSATNPQAADPILEDIDLP